MVYGRGHCGRGHRNYKRCGRDHRNYKRSAVIMSTLVMHLKVAESFLETSQCNQEQNSA